VVSVSATLTFGLAPAAGSLSAVYRPATGGAATSPVVVSVVGNHLVNGAGQTIRLLGVDRSGTEYACIEGWGIFDGPNSAASIARMAAWHINAVRLPLDEACWLGLKGVNPAYGGAAYRSAIAAYVKLLHAAGLAVILDLHLLDQTSQQPMADAAHAPAFWKSVAGFFKSDHGVIFDLFNEPFLTSWPCWLNGCTLSGGYKVAGMQSLVNAVRSTGAREPLMLGGLQWSSDESAWLAHEPTDPDHQLIVSFHTYNFSGCSTAACWNSTIAPLAKLVPVVTGENGENDCAHGYVDTFMAWADAHHLSYLGWTWDATSPTGWTCTGGPSLITSYSGTPTGYGAGLKDHLQALFTAGKLPPPLNEPVRPAA
jgi:hypothetical protein